MKYPIPNDWDGETWCNWSICWPGSPQWEALLRGFITLPQRGRTWDERTGSIASVQEIGRLITDENLPLWGCIVSCRDNDLALSIRYLADRLAASSCCTPGVGAGTVNGGTAGSGLEAIPPSEVDDTEPIGDPPPGFETWEAYFANKCSAAHWILNQWREDLERAQTVAFYAGMSLSVAVRLLAAAILTPIPGDELILGAAVLISAAGAGAINSVLEALEAVFTGFYSELVCALYEAGNVATAASNVTTIFQTNLDSEIPFVEGWALSLTRHWLTPDNLNRLFEPAEGVTYPVGDCSACDEPVCEDFDYDFVASDNGFAAFTPRCVDSLANSPSSSVTHTATGLELAAAGSGTRIITAQKDIEGVVIGPTSAINLYYINEVPVTTRISISLVTNLGCRYFYHDHGQGTWSHTYSLAAYDGEIIDKIQLSLSSNGGDPVVTFTALEYFCVAT